MCRTLYEKVDTTPNFLLFNITRKWIKLRFVTRRDICYILHVYHIHVYTLQIIYIIYILLMYIIFLKKLCETYNINHSVRDAEWLQTNFNPLIYQPCQRYLRDFRRAIDLSSTSITINFFSYQSDRSCARSLRVNNAPSSTFGYYLFFPSFPKTSRQMSILVSDIDNRITSRFVICGKFLQENEMHIHLKQCLEISKSFSFFFNEVM